MPSSINAHPPRGAVVPSYIVDIFVVDVVGVVES